MGDLPSMKKGSVFRATAITLIVMPFLAVANCMAGAGGTMIREGECLINVFPLYEIAVVPMSLVLITAFGGAPITLAAILIYCLFVWIVAKSVSVACDRWSPKARNKTR